MYLYYNKRVIFCYLNLTGTPVSSMLMLLYKRCTGWEKIYTITYGYITVYISLIIYNRYELITVLNYF